VTVGGAVGRGEARRRPQTPGAARPSARARRVPGRGPRLPPHRPPPWQRSGPSTPR
jgi:hypothetical protein